MTGERGSKAVRMAMQGAGPLLFLSTLLFAGALGGGLHTSIYDYLTGHTGTRTRTSTRTHSHRCLVTGVFFQILEPDQSITYKGRIRSLHTGVPHAGTHPVAEVDGGLESADPNMAPPNIEQNLRVLEESLSQGTPQRLFPDYRRPEAGPGGALHLADKPSDVSGGTMYDVIRVVATVTGAQATDKVYFRAFDIDDPTSERTAVDDDRPTNPTSEKDNRGRLTDVDGTRPGMSREGWWLIPTAAGPLQLVPGDQIVPVEIALGPDGSGSAMILFRTTHNAGDSFKIAAGCGDEAVDLLQRTRNVDRPAPYLSSNDGLILFLYKGGAGARPGVEERDPTYHPTEPMGAWLNETDDPIKVTSALTVWRNAFVELDAMTNAKGNIETGSVVDVSRERILNGQEVRFVTVRRARRPNFPFRINQLENGFLRLLPEDQDSLTWSVTGNTGEDKRNDEIVVRVVGAPNSMGALLAAANQGATVRLYDDDWEPVGGAGTSPFLGRLRTRVQTERKPDLGFIAGKGDGAAADRGDDFRFNVYAPAYLRFNYEVLNTAGVNRNPRYPAETEFFAGDGRMTYQAAKKAGILDAEILEDPLFWGLHGFTVLQIGDLMVGALSVPGSIAPTSEGANLTNDPQGSRGRFGVTSGPLPSLFPETSVLGLENMRDFASTYPGFPGTAAQLERYTVVHELSHQLLGFVHSPSSNVLYGGMPKLEDHLGRLGSIMILPPLTPLEQDAVRGRIETPGKAPPDVAGQSPLEEDHP
jgi:hypothetical protein